MFCSFLKVPLVYVPDLTLFLGGVAVNYLFAAHTCSCAYNKFVVSTCKIKNEINITHLLHARDIIYAAHL